jgi:Cobalamin-independent synthase, Catalytic domain
MVQASPPWPAGAATGVGSLPGTEIIDAAKMVFGELPLPHVPELPARGPGADVIGRTAGLLSSLPIELYAGQWRVAARLGRDMRRTRDLLDRDLDAITEAATGYAGPLKVQVVGVWSLAAGVDLPAGGRMLRDHGAVRDLASSLGDGVRAHLADLRQRIPAATLLVQFDEPSLPAVLAGRVPTESGWQTLRAVHADVVSGTLRSLVDAVGVPVVVHSCAADVPLRLLASTGAVAVSIDLGVMRDRDALGEIIDAGVALFAGAVRTSGPLEARPPADNVVADRIATLWRELGFPREQMATQVVVTPACGLAGATLLYARAAMETCVKAARRLADL